MDQAKNSATGRVVVISKTPPATQRPNNTSAMTAATGSEAHADTTTGFRVSRRTLRLRVRPVAAATIGSNAGGAACPRDRSMSA
jgi:hypothetical protein